MGICVSCRRRDRKAPQKRAPGAAAAQVPAKGAAAELLPRREPAMANSISNIKMTNPIKGIVSKRRKRYIKDGFNLDLAYITDKLIAMGFPAEKLEGVYRNHIDEVYRFLEQMHKDHYKLYNLCSERSYDSNKFHQRVERYAFDDHTPPKIELIQSFCVDVHRWLTADPKNVAAVHCKAGKGRTGTMVCCYLLYSGQKATADEALKFYGTKRTHDEKGVTIPSQRRYVQYYASLVRSRLSYSATKVHIRELIMSPPPMLNGAQCGLELAAVQAAPKREAPSGCQEVRKHDGHIRVILTQCTPLQGDVRVDVYNKPKMMMRKEKLFHFWFNTFFVTNCVGATKIQPPPDSMNLETFKITLNKWELDDAHKDKQHKLYSENFKVELIVQKQPETSTFSGQCARSNSPPSSASSSPSPPSSDGEPDGNWDSGEHHHHHFTCDFTRPEHKNCARRESERYDCGNTVNIPFDKNCANGQGTGAGDVTTPGNNNCVKLGAACVPDSEHYCSKNTINIPCDKNCANKKGIGACDTIHSDTPVTDLPDWDSFEHFCKHGNNVNVISDVSKSRNKKSAKSRGFKSSNAGLSVNVSCDGMQWNSEHPCCKKVFHLPCDIAGTDKDKKGGSQSKNSITASSDVAKANNTNGTSCINSSLPFDDAIRDNKTTSESCKGEHGNMPSSATSLSVDVSCDSNKCACTNFTTNSKSANKTGTCDSSRKFNNHGDMHKQCACLSDALQNASKPRLHHCEHTHLSKNTVCICELPTHDKYFKHNSCDTKRASDDTSDEVKVPYTQLNHCDDSRESKDDVTAKSSISSFDKSPLDSTSVDSQLSDRTDSSIANSQMSEFYHGPKCNFANPKLSNDYCEFSKNSESSSSRLSSDCCHRSMSMQLSSNVENFASSNHKTHNANCKALDNQSIEIRSKIYTDSCKKLDSNADVLRQSCYEVGSRCLNRNAVSLDSYSKVCEVTDDSAFKLCRNESHVDMSTQASSNEVDDDLTSAGTFTRSSNSSMTKETRSLLHKDKKKQKKRDDSNASGKIPKVSSDHTISDDSKKKYTLFNRKDEDGVSKPRLSLGDMRASWREFSGKWSESRKKKDRDN